MPYELLISCKAKKTRLIRDVVNHFEGIQADKFLKEKSYLMSIDYAYRADSGEFVDLKEKTNYIRLSIPEKFWNSPGVDKTVYERLARKIGQTVGAVPFDPQTKSFLS